MQVQLVFNRYMNRNGLEPNASKWKQMQVGNWFCMDIRLKGQFLLSTTLTVLQD